MSNFFSINGYWIDDKEPFEGLIVYEYDSEPDDDDAPYGDEDIFFYGFSESDLEEAIELGEDTIEDFVITSYYKI